MPVQPANLLMYMFMNILIEDAEKLEYLTSNSQWTKEPAKGKNFVATRIAFAAAKREPIGKFNIVAYITESQQFINMDHGRGQGVDEAGAVNPLPAAA